MIDDAVTPVNARPGVVRAAGRRGAGARRL